MLIHNHKEANRGKIKGELSLNQIFGFCKTFKKITELITENLGFHSFFKTSNLQDIIYTTKGGDNNITSKSLFLYVPVFIPNAETQATFIDSIKNNHKVSFESWYIDREVVKVGLECQVDLGSAQNITSPKYLLVAHQTADRKNIPNKQRKLAIFDNLVVRKNFCQIDV